MTNAGAADIQTVTPLLEEFRYPKASRINRKNDTDPVIGSLEAAALRQFGLLRLMAYGIEPGDATRLLEAVADGAPWEESALELEVQLYRRQEETALSQGLSPAAEQEYLTRRSALLRISQAMEVLNTETRRRTYLEAAALFSRAKAMDKRYRSRTIESSEGTLHAWEIWPTEEIPRGVVLVLGGVDGWSMDWDGLGQQIAHEGYIAVVLDGPGQGESRYTHETYLGPTWIRAYRSVIDYMNSLADGLPLFAVGNSMAAGMVLQIQSVYGAFSGVCSNGPVKDMSQLFSSKTYGRKLASFCGKSVSLESARDIFGTIDLTPDRVKQATPVLLLQGDEDPMVPVSDGRTVLAWTQSAVPSFALFERGEHVINRFPADKHLLIRSWLTHLTQRQPSRVDTPKLTSINDLTKETQP